MATCNQRAAAITFLFRRVLKQTDFDLQVRRKDCYTLLSEKLLAELRHVRKAYRPGEWLFPKAGRQPAR